MSEITYLSAWPTWFLNAGFRRVMVQNGSLLQSVKRWIDVGTPCPYCTRTMSPSDDWAVCTTGFDGVTLAAIPIADVKPQKAFTRRVPTPEEQLRNVVTELKESLEVRRKIPILPHQWLVLDETLFGKACLSISCTECSMVDIVEPDRSWGFPPWKRKPDRIKKELHCRFRHAASPVPLKLSENSRQFMIEFVQSLSTSNSPMCVECLIPLASVPFDCEKCHKVYCRKCVQVKGGKAVTEIDGYLLDGQIQRKRPKPIKRTRTVTEDEGDGYYSEYEEEYDEEPTAIYRTVGKTTTYWRCIGCKHVNVVSKATGQRHYDDIIDYDGKIRNDRL